MGPFPPPAGANHDVHFVLKGSDTPTTADGFIAIMMNTDNVFGYKAIPGNGTWLVEFADAGTLTTTGSGAKWLYQGSANFASISI